MTVGLSGAEEMAVVGGTESEASGGPPSHTTFLHCRGRSVIGSTSWGRSSWNSQWIDQRPRASSTITRIATPSVTSSMAKLIPAAAITMLAPILIALAPQVGLHPVAFTMLVADTDTFAYLLPTQITAAVIAYSSGTFTMSDYFKVGWLAVLIAILPGCALMHPGDAGMAPSAEQAAAWEQRVALLSPIDRFTLQGRVASGALGFKADLLDNQGGNYQKLGDSAAAIDKWREILKLDPGHDLAHVLILPTYTATAWFHGKLPDRYDGDLQAALDEAEAFALAVRLSEAGVSFIPSDLFRAFPRIPPCGLS